MHVQADEIRVKGCKMMAWMGLAMMVSTRLWLGGVVQLSRDRGLADQMPVPGAPLRCMLAPPARVDRLLARLSGQHKPRVPREGQANCGGWTSMRGLVWPELHLGTVIKRTENKRVVEVTRRMASGLLA